MTGSLHKMPVENLRALFDFVTGAVCGEGGDGYGYVLSDNPAYLADKFGEYDEWFNERTDHVEENLFVFSHDQEAVFFGPIGADTPYPDIVVTVKY